MACACWASSATSISPTCLSGCAALPTWTHAAARRGGPPRVAWSTPEAIPNTFPRLPVRAGEHVLLGLALFGDAAALQSFANSGAWARDVAPGLAPWLARAPETHRLQPTARSALHA